MIVNPDKFQATIFDKRKGNHRTREIKAESKVKPLGKEIDDKLNFEHHINNICKSVLNKTKTSLKIRGKNGASKYTEAAIQGCS